MKVVLFKTTVQGMKTNFITQIKLISFWVLAMLFIAIDQTSAGVFDLVPNRNISHSNLHSHYLIAENPILIDGQLDFQKTNFTSIPADFYFHSEREYWIKLPISTQQTNIADHWITLGLHDEVILYRDQQYLGKTGRTVNKNDCMHPVHRHWLSLMPLSKTPTDYYFHVKTSPFQKPTPLTSQIKSLEMLNSARSHQMEQDISFHFFRISILAIMIFMSVVTFAQFVIKEDQAYRCYGFYLLFTFFYLLISFEQRSPFSFLIESYFAGYHQALVIPTLMLSYYFYTQFVRSILETRTKLIRFDYLLRSHGYMTLFFVGLDLVTNLIFSLGSYPHIRSFMLIATFTMAMLVYFQMGKIKGIVAKLVLTGSLIFSLGSFMGFLFTTFLKLPEGLGIFSDGLTYMQISVLLEVIFFTVALAYLSWQGEKDKAEAKANLITEIYEKEKLVYQNEKSKEFEERRSQFFADTNHELRTPLTIIKGMAENLDKESPQRNIILQNTNSILHLINNMLDLAKAEAGDVKVNMLQDNFVTFCISEIEAWTYFAKTKGIKVIYEPEQSLILMDFDDRKMEQIISNLVSNAIKFTPTDGRITITTKEENEQLILTIEDTGSGIPKEDLPNVFDRYYRAKNAQDKNIEGTGIGLALVKKLVELVHGRIEIFSELERGTSFVLYFPITKLAPYGKAKISLDIAKINQQSQLTISPAPNDAPSLLIVEDNPEILKHLEYALGNAYNTTTATNGSEGIAKARKIFPDLIISDVRMPVQDGLTLCDTLKKDLTTSHIPIILLTAASTDDDKIKGLERRADAYLTKPFSQVELELRIENLLQVKKTLHAYFSKNINPETIQKSQLSKEDQSFLDQLVRFIKENIDDENLDVTQMTQAVNVSRPTLHSKLKALTGLSATKFKKQIKMQEAKRMLDEGHSNISDLAYQLGYKYPNNFSKDFKKWYGVAPNKFGKGNHPENQSAER